MDYEKEWNNLKETIKNMREITAKDFENYPYEINFLSRDGRGSKMFVMDIILQYMKGVEEDWYENNKIKCSTKMFGANQISNMKIIHIFIDVYFIWLYGQFMI